MHMFGLSSYKSLAAARVGGLHMLRIGGQIKYLRHASAVSAAIAKNMSSLMSQPSELLHKSGRTDSTSFLDTHNHYSFIAVVALMSLFLVVTISATGLLLAFCRKKNTVFTAAPKADGDSQLELDDIDNSDIEMCRGQHGECYYQLTDDCDEDDDDEDDDIHTESDGFNGGGRKRSKTLAELPEVAGKEMRPNEKQEVTVSNVLTPLLHQSQAALSIRCRCPAHSKAHRILQQELLYYYQHSNGGQGTILCPKHQDFQRRLCRYNRLAPHKRLQRSHTIHAIPHSQHHSRMPHVHKLDSANVSAAKSSSTEHDDDEEQKGKSSCSDLKLRLEDDTEKNSTLHADDHLLQLSDLSEAGCHLMSLEGLMPQTESDTSGSQEAGQSQTARRVVQASHSPHTTLAFHKRTVINSSKGKAVSVFSRAATKNTPARHRTSLNPEASFAVKRTAVRPEAAKSQSLTSSSVSQLPSTSVKLTRPSSASSASPVPLPLPPPPALLKRGQNTPKSLFPRKCTGRQAAGRFCTAILTLDVTRLAPPESSMSMADLVPVQNPERGDVQASTSTDSLSHIAKTREGQEVSGTAAGRKTEDDEDDQTRALLM